jgi:heme-degrading monooxygenase HmoA
MVMRLVHVRFKIENLVQYGRLYEEEIIPALENVDGCLFAGLVQNIVHDDEGCSLTFWKTRERVEVYVGSGLFDRLLGLSRPFLADSSDWRLRLSESAKLEYSPVPHEPFVKSYQNPSGGHFQPPPGRQSASLYLRMVTMPVEAGKVAEFQRIYESEVHPALLATRGCRNVFMVENMEHPGEWVCVTIWDRKEDADRYDEDGGFVRTRQKFGPTLSGLFRWKVGVDRQLGRQAVTSDDIAVSGFRVIAGKSFAQH